MGFGFLKKPINCEHEICTSQLWREFGAVSQLHNHAPWNIVDYRTIASSLDANISRTIEKVHDTTKYHNIFTRILFLVMVGSRIMTPQPLWKMLWHFVVRKLNDGNWVMKKKNQTRLMYLSSNLFGQWVTVIPLWELKIIPIQVRCI